MPEYSSEQYKYLLIKHLQRSFSFPDEFNRCYTYTFFSSLLDGIELTEDKYSGFIQVLNKYMNYCFKNNIDTVGDMGDTDVDLNKQPLIDAFKEIGVIFEPVKNSSISGYDLVFTKPDGTVMTYSVGDGVHEFDINAVFGQEYSYAQKSLYYYQFKNIEVLNLDDIDCKKAGVDCYWSYDSTYETMTITGNGSYCGVSQEQQIGSGEYKTLIIGSNVACLDSPEASRAPSLATVVLLHAHDFPLNIKNFSYKSSFTATARTWDVYTDNEVFINYTWPEKLTINLHPLDEWQG